jgi:UDP-3-O-acyl-N-acetylglucosamine deacetylase
MECFYEQLERGKAFQMEFEVVRGGLLDCKLVISDPNDQVIIDKLAFFNRPVCHFVIKNLFVMLNVYVCMYDGIGYGIKPS